MCGSGVSVRRALNENGKDPKKPKVVPRDLTPTKLKKRVSTCTLLLDRAASTQWTRFIIAKDEK